MKKIFRESLLLIAAGLIAQSSFAQEEQMTYTISTVAGTGIGAYNGDGGLATMAAIKSPQGVYVDNSGNFYFSEAGNNTVRRVDKQTGIITTVAGTGTAGYSGDGGQATLAQLKDPSGLIIDQSGNLIIVDAGNHVLRQVNLKTGIITTIAGNGTDGSGGDGGPALSAQLSAPYQIAMDQSGNFYIGDGGAHRIRKIDKATGIISTVAGNGTAGGAGDGGLATAAELNVPYGIAVDGSGNLYIACHGNSTIRKVDKSTGNISTIAGVGAAGFGGDGGPATVARLNKPINVSIGNNGWIYVCDAYNQVIRVINPSTGIINTIAGGSSGSAVGDGGPATYAYIAYTWAMALDTNNNVYVAEVNRHRIRKVFPAYSTDFAVDDSTSICLNDSINFQNLAKVYDTSLSLVYKWQFPGGTPATSTAENPSVTYSQSGTYSAKLIVIADSNELFSDFITKSFTVTVNNPNNVSITGKGTIKSGESDTLTATGANQYLWSTGATTASIVVSPTQTTSYSVIGTNEEGTCPSTDTFLVTVDTTGDDGTNIRELAGEGKMVLYPNPSKDNVYIKFNNTEKISRATLQIIAVDGRVVAQHQIAIGEGEQVIPVNVARLAPGVYTLNLSNGALRRSTSFVKE